MALRALVLGAAAGGGLPQWNCAAQNSRSVWNQDAAAASQSSLAVTANGEDWAVLNTSPDLRSQIIANPQLHPREARQAGLRNTPIRAVLLTNGDIDHLAGLLTMREKQAFDLFVTSATAEVLDQNPIFNAIDRSIVPRRIR